MNLLIKISWFSLGTISSVLLYYFVHVTDTGLIQLSYTDYELLKFRNHVLFFVLGLALSIAIGTFVLKIHLNELDKDNLICEACVLLPDIF